MYYLYNIVR